MDPDVGTPAPERAFRLLGDETRLAILRAVWASSTETVSFTEIRERIGNPNSGHFNYHIDKLTGHFLSKAEDGYALTRAGREVVRAVLAGSLTERPRMESTPIDGRCVECGGELVAEYDEYGVVECPECGETVMWNEFPPAGLAGRTPEEVAITFDRRTRSRFRLAMDGICPNCAGEMSTELPGTDPRGDRSTTHRCRNCKYEARVPLFGHATRHPAVVSFYYERGVDVTDLPYWKLRALARDYTEEILTEDPWTARVTVRAGDRELRLTLDDALDVTDVDRPTR